MLSQTVVLLNISHVYRYHITMNIFPRYVMASFSIEFDGERDFYCSRSGDCIFRLPLKAKVIYWKVLYFRNLMFKIRFDYALHLLFFFAMGCEKVDFHI